MQEEFVKNHLNNSGVGNYPQMAASEDDMKEECM
jgi:hypothetical protein